ncbi:c-type cytochrome [Sphingobacterium sp. MYb382]|uniref:c-type cytochrome n=1 Tax=Sphingobacterium sp. MYb382 TaxID=2745278 RepID=UPI0030B08198
MSLLKQTGTHFKKNNVMKNMLLISICLLLLIACGNPEPKEKKSISFHKKEEPEQIEKPQAPTNGNKGIGPIKNFVAPAFDQAQADRGNKLFIVKCSMCHELKEEKLGPALQGVTTRRTSEWILNMILNSAEMLEKDKDAIALKAQYENTMVSMGLSEDEAKAVLAYLKQEDSK